MEKKYKVLVDDDKKYRFSPIALKTIIRKTKDEAKRSGAKVTTSLILEELSALLLVSNEAIKNWIYGYNGPADINTVKSIGQYFGIPYRELLVPVEDIKNMNTIISGIEMQETRSAIKEIYYAMNRLIEYAYDTNPYADFKWVQIGEGDPNESLDFFRELSSLRNDALKILHKRMLDIPVDTYEKIKTYINGELYEYCLIFYPKNNFEPMDHMYLVDTYHDYISSIFYSDMQDLFSDFIPAELRNNNPQQEDNNT